MSPMNVFIPLVVISIEGHTSMQEEDSRFDLGLIHDCGYSVYRVLLDRKEKKTRQRNVLFIMLIMR